MRPSQAFATSCAVLLLAASSASAQNIVKANQGANAARQGALDFPLLAQQIFRQADRNHNSILNRYEFSTAQLLTDNTIANLGRAGLIGRGRPLSLGQGMIPAGQNRQFRMLGQGGGIGAAGVRNAGLGGMAMGNGGMLATSITNTNHVTQPQFTSYFLNSVSNADAALRSMYANMRRGYNRTYARYGRGYGHRPYYGYGHPAYGYGHSHSALASTPTNHAKSGSSPGSNGQSTAGDPSPTASTAARTGGGGPINSAALTTSGGSPNLGTANPSYQKNLAHTHGKSASGNANAEAVRARITAMAKARALARNATYSGGGGPAQVSFSGGGHPAAGGGGRHSGGGGGGHPSGGGHHGHR